MLSLLSALALSTLSPPATASAPAVFVLTSAEKASGFQSLAECEQALGSAGEQGLRGSRFNRTAGNPSRCEIVAGEPLIVVYPKGHEPRR